MWNSRNQQLSVISLAMNPEEMATLHDVYRTYSDADRGKETTYIMQFLWQDLTSPYDIVGPYYTSSESLKGKAVLPCVLEIIINKLFHLYGFRVIAQEKLAATMFAFKGFRHYMLVSVKELIKVLLEWFLVFDSVTFYGIYGPSSMFRQLRLCR